MTVPAERLNATVMAREFLRDLIIPSKTPRVPKKIRAQALRILKHYPTNFDMKLAAKKNPDIWGKFNQEDESL